MITHIDGKCYADLIRSGLKHLERYRVVLNDLNVFPVPDGDTGTNMVMTLRYGYDAIRDRTDPLSTVSGTFASSAVYGARGNSGVIVSQFFKGMSAVFKGLEYADCSVFAAALESGCKYAYASVSQPVEGTMLTVLKDASLTVARSLPLSSIDEVIDVFLEEAKRSLSQTPELLPILKKASVVDSGGSGIVYFFEGMQKHLRGEVLNEAAEQTSDEQADLSLFNKDTDFSYGYCVEGLLQLKMDVCDFDLSALQGRLAEYGESVVSSLEGDKVKLHVHVKDLGRLMADCQAYGELLTVKIDNMTVQNLTRRDTSDTTERLLYDANRPTGDWAVVAVATNAYMQQVFFDMGADAVLFSEVAPSSQDFLDAFSKLRAKRILVFPNSANSILAATQAGELENAARVTVLRTRSAAECYAALAIMDFDDTAESAVKQTQERLAGIRQFSVYRAERDVTFGSTAIGKDDFFALTDNRILNVGKSAEAVALLAIDAVLKDRAYDIVTVFYGRGVSDDAAERLVSKIAEQGHDAEVASVPTLESTYDITVTFE